jgi:1,4-dihydroxy-2-naphthoate polyprenyltransferase
VIRIWMEILQTGTHPKDGATDGISRWLIITRAHLLPLSLFSVIIGGLLAALDRAFHPLLFILAALWLLPAQAVNLLVNDLFDHRQGIDTEDYARTRLTPHPLFHGLTSRGGLIAAALLLLLLDLAAVLGLAHLRGNTVWAFAAAVFLLNLFCAAPPLKLKQRGMGELAQVLLWGPAMTGGAYFAIAGDLPGSMWPATLPYGVSVSAALLGMYIDRREMDETRWVLTVPVLLGEKRARTVLQLVLWGYYLLVASLAASGLLPWTALFVIGSLPLAVRFIVALHGNAPTSIPETTPRARDVFTEHVRKPPSASRTPVALPPLSGEFRAWGRKWLRLTTWTFTLGLLAGVGLRLVGSFF